MSKLKDMTGQKFGRLTVIERGENSKQGRARWVCECECGGTALAIGSNLKNGNTTSCGCSRKSHGRAGTAFYKVWANMKARCGAPADARFPEYGGRGITVCERWQDFENFQADMGEGYEPGLQLDRIDNDGPYSPDNCHWATPTQNCNNTRRTRFVSFGGTPVPLSVAARRMGIKRDKLARIAKRKNLFVQPSI